jgi:hypothetical protein
MSTFDHVWGENQRGGPAFPAKRIAGRQPMGGDVVEHHPGMDLRDWFASQALQGIIACVRDHTGATDVKARCAKAFEYADAMMAAREVK